MSVLLSIKVLLHYEHLFSLCHGFCMKRSIIMLTSANNSPKTPGFRMKGIGIATLGRLRNFVTIAYFVVSDNIYYSVGTI